MNHKKINLYPEKCNICDGKVIYVSNARIYGREFGSGKCYYCTKCSAYVGTHMSRPKEAFGILANEEMRNLKMKCHHLFDAKWGKEPTIRKKKIARKRAYKDLAIKLGIPTKECHFGYFDMNMLNKAYEILKGEKLDLQSNH